MRNTQQPTDPRPRRARRIAAIAVDAVADFATLGEYRVIAAVQAPAPPAAELWATGVDWHTPPRSARESAGCRLPRARDRRLARAAIGV